MSLSDIVGGTTKLIGNSVSLSFKGLGAAVYVANQAVSAGLKVGKAAFDEVHEGYTQTDDLLSSQPKPPQATRPPQVRREPQQTEFDDF
jgi:hypothetical protein